MQCACLRVRLLRSGRYPTPGQVSWYGPVSATRFFFLLLFLPCVYWEGLSGGSLLLIAFPCWERGLQGSAGEILDRRSEQLPDGLPLAKGGGMNQYLESQRCTSTVRGGHTGHGHAALRLEAPIIAQHWFAFFWRPGTQRCDGNRARLIGVFTPSGVNEV